MSKKVLEKTRKIKKKTKHLAIIYSTLLDKNVTEKLQLQNESFIFLIPRKILELAGINKHDLTFDLIKEGEGIVLRTVADAGIPSIGFEDVPT